MYNKLKATVTGHTCEGEPFTEELVFTLIPPTGEHYGTGYYMRVEMSLSGVQLEDVRYARLPDIEFLADRFIAGWYGKNAEEIIKEFER